MPDLPRFLVLACLLSLPAGASEPPPADASPTLETVVVTGVMPGPGLWRVESGGRQLWILGTVSPLPRDMKWEALKVGELLAQADAVLSPAGAEADLSAGDVMKMMTLARSANAAIKLPDRGTLADVIPTETYAVWLGLKQQYLPNDKKVERQRPVFASQELYNAAIVAEGMTRTNIVWSAVSARAMELGVSIVDTGVRMPLALDRSRYKAGIQALANSGIDDVICFKATLETLAADLETMKRGANAWATGDLDQLRLVRHAELKPACKATYDEAMGFQKKPDWTRAARAAWLTAAESALADNTSTLAVLPMSDLLGPSGVLAVLRARGYTVVEPDIF
ncbi:MAG: TraB/GumN family protein [Arenimonas sp.]|uniref:TraB/GumN family protein n=1 Tax=Arenimonas sp. TaxID=1872635 RepID=UPI0025C3A3B0|nr:TraB/GumN family protein [Arenimonas sp.]MBW8367503.1 TraB/GumN family protein [Arenimonas sp.]